MTELLRQLRRGVPDAYDRDGNPLGYADVVCADAIMERAADEIERLRKALRDAADMTDHEVDRTLIYNHCMQAVESEVSDE